MKVRCRLASAGALFLPLLLSGCSLFPTTRKLPIPKAPLITQTATPEELVTRVNQRWASLDTLTATVEIQASVMKTKEGVAKDYTTLRGHILMRKPEMLRVVGTLLGVKAFDMASDGKDFTLSVPLKGKAFKGSNSLKRKSANALENMRPGFFFDAMVVRGLEPDDLYSVVADSETIEDTARKHLYTVPEYVLSISRRKGDSRQLTPVRVVTFRRDDLLPYQQDLYDDEGNLETQVDYANYRDFEGSKYPSTIIIKRPLEEYQIVLTVEDVKENQNPTLTDDQFVVKVPEGTETQKLE
jgi:outer membrane lipoprotein-sorting protein